MYAREYLISHMETPPGLSELARIIGINEYKLKRGFKEMFGNTVFGYLSDLRLEMAKNELLENRNTASTIASELGYSSVQHFSNAFKKKFGYAPSKLKW
jgi:AraC-like DNA-binding protein